MNPHTVQPEQQSTGIGFEGYAVEALLYESRQSRIYRGTRLHDRARVILKIVNEVFPSPEKRARFQQEYNLMRKLRSDAILSAYGMEPHRGMQVMIVEDFGGTSLNNLNLGTRLTQSAWLHLAVRIAACLEQLHQHHIMHKDINPSNIVWNQETDQIKLIDLGIATELSREMPEIRNPDRLEGTLAYLSPEQTGRMNRAMDYRTDFYSLGVTFYELLTGELPFASGDALELVHAHIARMPLPVDQVRPGISPMVSAIIAKLMAKTAEERYQSGAGLRADLQTCVEMIEADGVITDFMLGRHDFSGRLQISQKLYGRETQSATLLQVFERASRGPAELLLVAGYSGIGKSALVHEVRKPITKNRGYFIEGKFDQFKRDIPYASLSQAFRELIQQILTEGEAVVQRWKTHLLQVLGSNAGVIMDVIPTLELLIGPQAPIIELPAAQEQNRFNHEFRKFVGIFASVDHPLVIFLDDLQWADLPSLQLMSLLLRDPATPHLLLIGAYRDNEVTPVHSLSVTLRDLEKHGAAVHTISLPPLNLGEVMALLRDTLHASSVQVEELAKLCLAKTQGNPFFLNQFLGALVDRRILTADAAGWKWDMASVRQADITDNIVELMVARLHCLPVATQRVLQGAACLGNIFDLEMLAVVCKMSEADTAQLLWEALHEELIVPLDDHYKYVDQIEADATSRLVPSYRFLHDRVQQAAYCLSDADEKAAMHLAIGRLWLDTYSSTEQQNLLFDLVNHLNHGVELIVDEAERMQLVQLNLGAARKAKASAAYKPAYKYLDAALVLTADDVYWTSHYELLFALHLEAAEAAYLSFDLAGMERAIDVALVHARDLLDQAKVYEIRIQAFISRDKLVDALEQGLVVLRLLGVDFPRNPGKAHVLVSIVQTRRALAGKSMDDIANLPDVRDPHIRVARKILSNIISASYYVRPNYFVLFIMMAVRLSLKYGHAASSATNFATYGGLVSGLFGNAELGTRLCELALRLQERPIMAQFQSRTMFVMLSGIHPWRIPLHRTLEPLTQGYLSGAERGDVEFAANSAQVYCFHAFFCGNDLAELERTAAGYIPVCLLPGARDAIRVLQQAFINLMGQSDDPIALELVSLDPQQAHSADKADRDQSVMFASKSLVFQWTCTKLMLCYLFHDFRGAVDNADRAGKLLSSVLGFFGSAMYAFYGSLARLALLDTAAAGERKGLLKQVRLSHAKLRRWAVSAPANLLHKAHLVEAEMARRTGDVKAALHGYEQAIRLARDNNFPHEEALARELAGEFYLSRGIESMAKVYLLQARHGYRRWGALAKVRDLAARYPHWLTEQEPPAATFTGRADTISIAGTGSAGLLDLATVMKASQALSQEIVLERLLKRLMQIAIESAGAQRGLLLLKNDAGWVVQAEKSDAQDEAVVLQALALADLSPERMPLPLALVHFVARTAQRIVVHEARHEKLLANDPYLQQQPVRSLLMVPILHHGEMTGMLYLEHHAASDVFTESRLEVLHLLASQAAISIENAQLYADMEQRVAARTAELRAMSLRDALTGVANRRAFDERLAEEMARCRRGAQPLSLMIIDIDHFKRVNDTYGHPVGDACLRLLGAALTAACHRAADFIARYGGEEFVVLLPDMDLPRATHFAEEIRLAIEKIVLEIGEIRHPITASIGVAQASADPSVDGAALVANADRCLYLAKTTGRNRVVNVQVSETENC